MGHPVFRITLYNWTGHWVTCRAGREVIEETRFPMKQYNIGNRVFSILMNIFYKRVQITGLGCPEWQIMIRICNIVSFFLNTKWLILQEHDTLPQGIVIVSLSLWSWLSCAPLASLAFVTSGTALGGCNVFAVFAAAFAADNARLTVPLSPIASTVSESDSLDTLYMIIVDSANCNFS